MKPGLGYFASRAKAPFGTGLVLLLLFLQTVAASPLLHLDFHGDAAEMDHSCGASALAEGQIEVTDSWVGAKRLAALVPEPEAGIEPHLSLFFVPADSNRGPPSLA